MTGKGKKEKLEVLKMEILRLDMTEM